MARKKKPEEVPAGAPAWMATYGDLVTLLVCFFILLYAMSNVDRAKFEALAASFSGSTESILEGSGSEGIIGMLGSGITELPGINENLEQEKLEYDQQYLDAKKELEQMASDFKTYLAENNLETKIGLELTDQYIKLSLPDDIVFDSGSAELKPEILPVLDVIADAVINYPESDVEIEGHADNRPIHTIQYKNNWYLSSARATEVGTYFVDNKSISPVRIVTVGYGEYRPVASNDTPEGRAKNRRVEIKILSRYYSGGDVQ